MKIHTPQRRAQEVRFSVLWKRGVQYASRVRIYTYQTREMSMHHYAKKEGERTTDPGSSLSLSNLVRFAMTGPGALVLISTDNHHTVAPALTTTTTASLVAVIPRELAVFPLPIGQWYQPQFQPRRTPCRRFRGWAAGSISTVPLLGPDQRAGVGVPPRAARRSQIHRRG